MASRSMPVLMSRGPAGQLGQLRGGIGCLGGQYDPPGPDLFFDDGCLKNEIVADEGHVVLQMCCGV